MLIYNIFCLKNLWLVSWGLFDGAWLHFQHTSLDHGGQQDGGEEHGGNKEGPNDNHNLYSHPGRHSREKGAHPQRQTLCLYLPQMLLSYRIGDQFL